jgi:hypothetical protein
MEMVRQGADQCVQMVVVVWLAGYAGAMDILFERRRVLALRTREKDQQYPHYDQSRPSLEGARVRVMMG